MNVEVIVIIYLSFKYVCIQESVITVYSSYLYKNKIKTYLIHTTVHSIYQVYGGPQGRRQETL